MRISDRVVAILAGVTLGALAFLPRPQRPVQRVWRVPPRPPGTLAPGTRCAPPSWTATIPAGHPTHIWKDAPVLDTLPFPGADNPLAEMMTPDEWHELERRAMWSREV